MKWIIYILLYFSIVSFGSCVNNETEDYSNDDSLTNLFFDIADMFINFNTSLNETNCNEDLQDLVRSSARREPWAVNMTDATGKPPSGLSRTARIFLGQYDECLNVRHPKRNFIGQYCLMALNVTPLAPYIPKIAYSPVVAMYQLGVCLPSSCSPNYINRSIQSIFFPMTNRHLTDLLTADVSSDFCQTADKPRPFRVGDYLVLALIVLILLLTLLSTGYELYNLRTSQTNPLLSSFSLYSNGKILLRVETNTSHIGCFQGLRAISMGWVVYSHSVLTSTYSPVINPFEEMKFSRGPWALFINNGHENVDTFFIIGGFLVMISFMRQVQSTGGFDILLSYIKRYIRLTVVLAFLLVMQITLLDHLGSGPLLPLIQKFQKVPCLEKWYKLLFYYQNYDSESNLCFLQSWYLAMDMQLFWLSPLFLYPGIWWPRFGAFLAFAMAWVITGIEFFIGYKNDLGPTMTHTREPTHLRIDHYATHTRSAPWFMGILLGYILLYIRSQKNFRMSKKTVILGWTISMAIFWGNFFSLLAFDENYTQPSAALCLSLRRIGWSVGVLWIVIACSTGYGGYVDKFLSWGPFHFFGKLSHNVFLLHFMVIHHRIGLMKEIEYLTALKSVFNFTAMYIFMNLIAIPLALMIEFPCANVMRILLENKQICRLPRRSTGPIRQNTQSTEKRLEMQMETSEEINYASNGEQSHPS